MYPIKQSTAVTIPIFVHDENGDAVTGLVDGGFTKRIKKSGSWAAMTVTITETENGWYDLPLTTSHTDTLALLSITLTHASAKQVNLQFRVDAKLIDDLNDLGGTAQTADHTSAIAAIPTSLVDISALALEATLNDRTLLAADYATAVALGNLAVGSAAISAPATGLAPTIGGYTGIVGTETNTFASAETLNQVYHEIAGTDPNLDIAYAFDVGDNGVGTEVVMIGRFVGNGNETIDVQAWNFTTTAWDGIGSFISSNGDTDITSDGESRFNINKGHTGVNGADKGIAYIRGVSTNMSSAALKMDQVYISYAVVAQSVGYDGAQVWIDTVNGEAGTTKYINGVADNPVLTLADAITIGSNVPLKRYNVSPDSSIIFAESHTDEIWSGAGWSLVLGGQDVSSSHFFHCNDISGIGTSPSGEAHILNSHIGVLTLGVCHITNSSFSVSFTASVAGSYAIDGSGSGVSGAGNPTMTYSGLGAATTIDARGWKGGASWVFDSNCITTIEVVESGTHTITNDGGDIEFRGTPKALNLVVSGAGTINVIVWSGCPITISGTATTAINIVGIHSGITDTSTGTAVDSTGSTDITKLNDVLVDTDELQQAQSDWATAAGFATETKQDASDILIADIPNTAEFEARTPTAAQLLYIVNNAATGYPVTFSAGSTTTVTLTLVDGATASAVNDQYKGRLIVFTNGSNKGVVTDITAYNGTTKVATITTVPSDPSASAARLI